MKTNITHLIPAGLEGSVEFDQIKVDASCGTIEFRKKGSVTGIITLDRCNPIASVTIKTVLGCYDPHTTTVEIGGS